METGRVYAVDSPCVGVCALDERGVCRGCHRTANEIANWLEYSDAERGAIMDALEARAGRHGSA